MLITGWIIVALEIILLLLWINDLFFSRNGTDPAGRGMAMFFLFALVAYVGVGILFMVIARPWSLLSALIMGALPLTIVVIGLVKQSRSKRQY